MTWLSILLAAVKFLTAAVQFFQQRQLLKAGQAQEIAEALRKAAEEVALANAAGDEAEKRHQQDPSDGAFDQDFKRED